MLLLLSPLASAVAHAAAHIIAVPPALNSAADIAEALASGRPHISLMVYDWSAQSGAVQLQPPPPAPWLSYTRPLA